MMSIKALIVEDHPLFRGALMHLAHTIFGEAGVMEASSAEEGLRLAGTLTDLRFISIDLGLPGMNGAEAVLAFSRKCPAAAIIVVSASEDRREATAALRAGAKAFVSKASSMDTMTEVIRRVLAGEALASAWVAPGGNNTVGEECALTPRQREILVLLSQGHSNKEISIRLGLALVTVKIHVSSIFRSLNVLNRTQAVLAARRMGIFTAPDDAAA